MPLLQTFDLGKSEHGWSQRIRIPAFVNKTVSTEFFLTTSVLPFSLSFYHLLVHLL